MSNEDGSIIGLITGCPVGLVFGWWLSEKYLAWKEKRERSNKTYFW